MFLIFSNNFDVLISKIIFKNKKNIILMCFEIKYTLKNNHYYIFKYSFKLITQVNKTWIELMVWLNESIY
jgi:hypothetical protein